MKKPIKIRGHHLVKITDYENEKDVIRHPEYGLLNYWNEKRVLKRITGNPNHLVQITDNLDDICSYCRAKNKECSDARGQWCDRNYAGMAGLKVNKIYTAEYLLNALKTGNFNEFMEFRKAMVLKILGAQK